MAERLDRQSVHGNVPQARRTRARRCCAHSTGHVEDVARRLRIQEDDFPYSRREGLAVPASARHESAGGGAVRNGCRRQSAGGSLHQRDGDQSDASGRHRQYPAHANLRIPCNTVGTKSRERRDLHRREDRRLPGAPAGRQRSEVLGLRRRGVGGSVVLQQSDLHRSQGSTLVPA